MQRQCGWCGRTTREDDREQCASCAGPLPPLPRAVLVERGAQGLALVPPAPPAPPRVLPPAYVRRVKLTDNVLVILGVIFTLVFFWTLVFPIIGIPLWVVGARRAERQLRALREGIAVEGTLVEVAVDHSTRSNNRHPWLLRYVFQTPRGSFEGVCSGWDRLNGQREPGEAVQVVYVPGEEETVSSLWPPVS